MTEAIKKHHFLITGEIVFRARNSEDVNAIRTNAVLLTEDTIINVAAIGKSQQLLQLNFHKKMSDDNIEVLDVVILNLSYLGNMSEAEFQAPPAGMKQQEKAPTSEAPAGLAPLATQGDALDQALDQPTS